MTRHVGENTGQRVAAGARWGVEDLRKRPAPESVAGAGTYPYVFRKRTTNQTIDAGAVEYIDWVSSDFDEAAGYFTAGDNFSCNIVGAGVYDFLAGVKWEPEFNSVAMIQVECNAFGWSPTVYGKGALYTSGGLLLDGVASLFIHFQARVSSGTSPVAVVLGHENAANQIISDAFFRIARVASWTGAGVGAEADFVFL